MSQEKLRLRIATSVISKLRAIRSGRKPTVLDLFAGCGGISLGFERAGCVVVGGVERDPDAAASFSHNFKDKRIDGPPHWLTDGPMDITRTNPVDLAARSGVPLGAAVDILVGGPPCQAFARIGRAKLRSVSEDPEAWLNDPRVDLYKSYLHFVADFAPCALMMENVPDFMSHGGGNTAESVCSNLEALGYRASYTLMNSSFWGVPQHRERMILVAFHQSVEADWYFPEPTHLSTPPSGYKGVRATAMAMLPAEGGDGHRFVPPPDSLSANLSGLPAHITVHQALSDIPPIPIGEITASFSRMARSWSYRRTAPGKYQKLMRHWSGHSTGGTVDDHLTRYLPRDFKIFSKMAQGEQYPKVHYRQSKLRDKMAKARGLEEDSASWKELTKELVPPYKPNKFPNKWYRLRADEPSRTLLAHLGKDGYTHIHPTESRVISVREAARLQSFPDGFRFCGSMNAMFRQIGNSVPPLLSAAVAEGIVRCLSLGGSGRMAKQALTRP